MPCIQHFIFKEEKRKNVEFKLGGSKRKTGGKGKKESEHTVILALVCLSHNETRDKLWLGWSYKPCCCCCYYFIISGECKQNYMPWMQEPTLNNLQYTLNRFGSSFLIEWGKWANIQILMNGITYGTANQTHTSLILQWLIEVINQNTIPKYFHHRTWNRTIANRNEMKK